MVAPVQALVQAETNFTATTPVSFGAPTTSGSTIFVNASNDGNLTVTSITDDATPTNTYVQDVIDTGATTFGPTTSELWHSTTSRPATTITIHWSGNPVHGDGVIAEYPGGWNLVTPSGDNHAHSVANAYGAGPASGNFSNAAIGDLLLGVTLCNGLNTDTTGYTNRYNVSYFYWEDETAAAVSATNAIAPSGGFQGWLCIGAAYTPASVTPAPNALFFGSD